MLQEVRAGVGERERSAPPPDAGRRSRRDPGLARGADGHPQSTLRYDRMMLLLDATPFARELAGKKVEVVNYSDGRFAVRHKGVALLDKIHMVAPGAIVENKRLSEALAFARKLQGSYSPNRRRDPRRQRPPNNLEAPGMPTKGRRSRKVLAAAAARVRPAERSGVISTLHSR